MKRSLLLLAPLLLVACKTTTSDISYDALLKNPLFVEQYAEQLVETMVNLEIYEDPIVEDVAKKKVIDATKEYWLQQAVQARKDQRNGMKGNFIQITEYTEGEVLFTGDAVHFGPTFSVSPGPELRVILTNAIDPRDVTFPDETAIDVGELTVPYGAQSFILKEKIEDITQYRTVVLWDKKLDRLYAFAQMSQ